MLKSRKNLKKISKSFKGTRGGVSLAELSIVAVIGAILLGLILSSNKIIESAQVREVVSSEEKRGSAEQLFMTKYNAKPGDFRRATTLLSAAGLPGGINLVNGDGDGTVEDSGPMIQETVQYAVHLKAAGLYDEDSDLTTGCMSIKQRFGSENTCLRMRFSVNIPGVTGGIQHINISAFTSGSTIARAAIPGDAARAFDLKMGDDGLPNFNASARNHLVFVPGPEIEQITSNNYLISEAYATNCLAVGASYFAECLVNIAKNLEKVATLSVAGGAGGAAAAGGCPGGTITKSPGASCGASCEVCQAGTTCCSGTCQSTCSGGAGGSSGGSGGSSGGTGGSSGGSGGAACSPINPSVPNFAQCGGVCCHAPGVCMTCLSGGSGGSTGGAGGTPSGGAGGTPSGGAGGTPSGGSGGGPGPGPGTGGGGIGGIGGGPGAGPGGSGGMPNIFSRSTCTLNPATCGACSSAMFMDNAATCGNNFDFSGDCGLGIQFVSCTGSDNTTLGNSLWDCCCLQSPRPAGLPWPIGDPTCPR